MDPPPPPVDLLLVVPQPGAQPRPHWLAGLPLGAGGAHGCGEDAGSADGRASDYGRGGAASAGGRQRPPTVGRGYRYHWGPPAAADPAASLPGRMGRPTRA